MRVGKFIVVVLDGFGIGAMDDVERVRPADIGSNTCTHIFDAVPNLHLPNLACLGLANAVGFSYKGLPTSCSATYGAARLTHFWADTFFAHQEIMGTKPHMPRGEAINDGHLDLVARALREAGFHVERHAKDSLGYLVIDGACTVADNIECDPGQAINVTAALEDMPFSRELEVGRIVRDIVHAPRVITFGGGGIHLNDLLEAVEVHGRYIGVNAPSSGVYKAGYQCVHMGYGVDERVQVPYLLGSAGIPVHLIGKVADVCANAYGASEPMVDTYNVLSRAIEMAELPGPRFICANVQETDLAGHSQDAGRFADRLQVADERIGVLRDAMDEDDLLIVMADHGNDPTIGHPHHTRERVPLLIAGRHIRSGYVGERETLSDVGATACDFFSVKLPENGTSFLSSLNVSIPQ